jgi:WKF domain
MLVYSSKAISAATMTAAIIDSNGDTTSDALPPQRVPAWKKLGLRLKLTEEQPTQLDDNTATNRKRPRDEDSQNLPEAAGAKHNLRKRMRLDPPNTLPTKSNVTNVKVLSPSLRRDSNGIRKTVSFTSDTKVEDGDSSKSLIADWAAQYDQPSFSANLPKGPERAKEKPSKAKVTKSNKSKSRPTTKKPHAALEYLTQFCDSRDTWKFRKNREVWILKHLFSIDDIPPKYDISLSQYLRGLKPPSACSRIRQEAKEIIRKDCEQYLEYTVSSGSKDGERKVEEVPADMEDPERRRAYYEDSVRRYKRKLEQHLDEVAEEELNWVSPERLAKRRRAEILLWATGVTPSSADATQSSDAAISEQETSRNGSRQIGKGAHVKITQKKRKNRTSVIELPSSSEDGSSDSDSESDTDEGQGGDVAEDSDSDGGSTETNTRTQTSGSRSTQQEVDLDKGTESSSSSDETSDESHSDVENAAINNVRAKSIISISS